MTNKKLHTILKQIARKTYGNSVPEFYVELEARELESRHGKYDGKNKVMTINNISRDNECILVTAIHELAHHVEYTVRGKVVHDDQFYKILKELLESAVMLGYLNYEKVRNIPDTTTISMMERKYGPVRVRYDETLDVNRDWRTVYVYNGYSIKEILKEKNYMFSSMEGIWEKDLRREEAETDLQEFLTVDPELEVQIKRVTDLSFDPLYQITLSGQTYPYKDELKKRGYIYGDKRWKKRVRKETIKEERSFIDSLSGVVYDIR